MCLSDTWLHLLSGTRLFCFVFDCFVLFISLSILILYGEIMSDWFNHLNFILTNCLDSVTTSSSWLGFWGREGVMNCTDCKFSLAPLFKLLFVKIDVANAALRSTIKSWTNWTFPLKPTQSYLYAALVIYLCLLWLYAVRLFHFVTEIICLVFVLPLLQMRGSA